MTFERIYKTNAWNGIETRSGPGSHAEPTRRVAEAIAAVARWLAVDSVLDVGCGEGSWMPDLPGYYGIDVAPEAIKTARRNHPARNYGVRDSLRALLPYADLVIIRDVIQHLPLDDGRVILANLDTRWLLVSTYIDGVNVDIAAGDAYRPNLQAAPFAWPPPVILIPDGYVYHDGDAIRDPGKMLGLWRMA